MQPLAAVRLTQPFVTWSLLVAEFSELAAEVASKYFTEMPTGRYAFRPAYNRWRLLLTMSKLMSRAVLPHFCSTPVDLHPGHNAAAPPKLTIGMVF